MIYNTCPYKTKWSCSRFSGIFFSKAQSHMFTSPHPDIDQSTCVFKFTVCTKRTDVIIIMDEWDTIKSYTLLRHFASMIQTYNSKMELGLVAQSKTFNNDTGNHNALEIPLGKAKTFLKIIQQHTERFCCGSISAMMEDALAMFEAKTTRQWFWPSILLVSSRNAFARENITVIADAYSHLYAAGLKRWTNTCSIDI